MNAELLPKHYVLMAVYVGFHAYVAWLSWRSREAVARAALPPLSRHFARTVVTQLLLLLLSLIVAFSFRFTPFLFPRVLPKVGDVLLGVAAAGALVAFMRPRWKHAVRRGSRRLYFFMPKSAGEKGWWVGVSAAAAVGEEVTYRGVLYLIFLMLTGSGWLAALFSALLFAGGHAFQGGWSVVIIFGFALVFQGLAFKSGSLYVSMLTHFLYDVAAGLSYSKLGREMGYVAATAPEAPAPAPEAATPG